MIGADTPQGTRSVQVWRLRILQEILQRPGRPRARQQVEDLALPNRQCLSGTHRRRGSVSLRGRQGAHADDHPA